MEADYEIRTIAALLHSTKTAQQEYYTKGITPGIFKVRTKEMEWITRYREDFGEYPSVIRYSEKWGKLLMRPRDSLKACLQVVIDKELFERLKLNIQTVKDLVDDNTPMEEVIARYRRDSELFASFGGDLVQVDRSTSKAPEKYYKQMVDMKLSGKPFADSPWPTMNKLVGLFFPKDVAFLQARLNMGKTWIVMYWADYLASKGLRVLLLSFEMSQTVMELRDEAIHRKVAFDRLKNGELSPKELREWRKAQKVPDTRNLVFVGKPENLRKGKMTKIDYLVQAVEKNSYDAIIVDAAYMPHPSGLSTKAGPNERLAALSSFYMDLGANSNAFVLPVLQSNRDAEDSKSGKTKPGVNSLYGSDTFGQDGDFVIGIGGNRGSDTRQVELAKSRNSAIGQVTIDFIIEPYPYFGETRRADILTNAQENETKQQFHSSSKA